MTRNYSTCIAAMLPVVALACATVGVTAHAADAAPTKRVEQVLVAPPALPQHAQVASGSPVTVTARLVVEEKLMQVSKDGAKIWAMTFGGSVPGPIIVLHEGDWLELTLVNPATSSMAHNIDIHAATGARGGGALTTVPPGSESVLRFKATHPGVFVYNCAPGGVLTVLHVVSGMNGAIMVLPRDGLKDASGKAVRYDRAYYIGEQDYYIPRDANGKFKVYTKPVDGFNDMMAVMRTLTPSHLVYNGVDGALTDANSLHAKVGERVLFIHSQANRDTRVRLSGGVADLVWQGGSFLAPPVRGLESWPVAAGSAVAMLYQFRQPGVYLYENHNLIESYLFSAQAQVQVSGAWDDSLMYRVGEPHAVP